MQITKMWAVNIWLISFIIHNSDENNGPISNDTKTDSIFVFFINEWWDQIKYIYIIGMYIYIRENTPLQLLQKDWRKKSNASIHL